LEADAADAVVGAGGGALIAVGEVKVSVGTELEADDVEGREAGEERFAVVLGERGERVEVGAGEIPAADFLAVVAAVAGVVERDAVGGEDAAADERDGGERRLRGVEDLAFAIGGIGGELVVPAAVGALGDAGDAVGAVAVFGDVEDVGDGGGGIEGEAERVAVTMGPDARADGGRVAIPVRVVGQAETGGGVDAEQFAGVEIEVADQGAVAVVAEHDVELVVVVGVEGDVAGLVDVIGVGQAGEEDGFGAGLDAGERGVGGEARDALVGIGGVEDVEVAVVEVVGVEGEAEETAFAGGVHAGECGENDGGFERPAVGTDDLFGEIGPRVADLKGLAAVGFEIIDAEGVGAGREGDGAAFLGVALEAVVIDDERTVDVNFAAVVGLGVERVGACLGDREIAGETECVEIGADG